MGSQCAVYGRFVPTALWMGASLYDGLNPQATGASDMSFFWEIASIWPLDEQDQDAELTRRAIAFARERAGACASAWLSSSSGVTGAPGPMPRACLRLSSLWPARSWSSRSSG